MFLMEFHYFLQWYKSIQSEMKNFKAPQTGFCLLFQLQQIAGTRLFWKSQEVSISLATGSLKQVFLRAVRHSETGMVELNIRGFLTTGDATKSFMEIVQCRI